MYPYGDEHKANEMPDFEAVCSRNRKSIEIFHLTKSEQADDSLGIYYKPINFASM